MSGTGPAANAEAPQAAPDADAPAPHADGQQGQAAGAPPKHLYDAVATQRDHVLDSFDAQRNAVLQAVAEQREAAMAPIHTVQARHATQAAASPAGAVGPGGRAMPPLTRQQAVAADIVAALRAMVAEEVRVQVCALLELAAQREAAVADARRGSKPVDHKPSGKD